MNRAPKTVQQKQQQRANLRSESKSRSFNKEGFSSHGERNANINVRQQHETSMFDKEAIHTQRERSNNSSKKGKPGPPGKPQLPFFGTRRFTVESPQNYTAVLSLLDKVTFHLYSISVMTWLFNVIFSKYLRIHKLEKRKPIVNPADIEKAFLNLYRNKFDFFALEEQLGLAAVAARDNITNIRNMAAFTKHRPDSVVDCLKRYMSYKELKDMRHLSASLKETSLISLKETSLISSTHSIQVHADYEKHEDSFWGKQSINHHSVHSSLNGNNGSWTGTDDVDCAECKDGDDCLKCCHHHLQRKGRGKGKAEPPATGAKRRVVEAKKLVLCADICPGMESHFHPENTFCLTCSPKEDHVKFDFVGDAHGLFDDAPILPKLNRKERRALKRDVGLKVKKELNSDLYSAFVEDDYVSRFTPSSNIQVEVRDECPTPSKDILSVSSKNLPDIGDIYDLESCFADQTPADYKPSAPPLATIEDYKIEVDLLMSELDEILAEVDHSTHSSVSTLTQSDRSDPSMSEMVAGDNFAMLAALGVTDDDLQLAIVDNLLELTVPPPTGFGTASDLSRTNPATHGPPNILDTVIRAPVVLKPVLKNVIDITPAAGPVILTEQSPLRNERFYLAGDVTDESFFAYLTKGTFLSGIFSGTSVIGQETEVVTSTSHFFGLITFDSSHSEYSWRDLGFTKFKDLEIHPELAKHVTRYAIENRLVKIETSQTGKRTFGFREHAESAIREYLSTHHKDLDKFVKDKWLVSHSYTIAWGLQQAMRPALMFNDVQTSKFPVVNKQGNDHSRPTSSIGRPAVKG